MKSITREQYLDNFKKVDRKEAIDTSQYSDEYIQIGNAYCGIHFQKYGIIQINGLFSLSKGDGRKLINELKDFYDKIRLNCIGKKLESYYQDLGFETYLQFNEYKELMWCKYHKIN